MSGGRRRGALLPWILCLAAALGGLGGGPWAAPAWAQDQPVERGSRGRLVLADGVERVALQADRLMTPASVLKLVVAAAALHHLGPEQRITTRLRSAADLREASLAGDLYIEAAGDPTWSAQFFPENPRRPLDLLAAQVRQRGIEVVDGDLVVSTAHFPGRRLPTSRALDEFPYAWAAPVSALAVDDNGLRIEISPGSAPGQAARARLLGSPSARRDPAHDDIAPRLINRMTTVSAQRHGKGSVDILPSWQGRDILLRGEYPVSEPAYVIAVSHPQPDLYGAQALRRALERQGITVAGDVRTTTDPVPAAATTLAAFASAPLAERLPPILAESRNWHAEMLLRTLAFEVEGSGRHATGLDIEARFLVEIVGLDEASFLLDDASGLSPYNLVSPRAVAELLRFAWSQPWRQSLVDALAKPGQGTLEAWGHLPPVAAKTGTLRHTIGLAGFLDPPTDTGGDRAGPTHPVIFVDLINHDPNPRPRLRARIRRDLWKTRSTGD